MPQPYNPSAWDRYAYVDNNMGRRIFQDYPVTIGSVSHATALTFGYLAGKKAAA